MTTTQEQFETDNSALEQEISTPTSDTATSSTSVSESSPVIQKAEEISTSKAEPVSNRKEAVSQANAFSGIEIPEKFKNKDGSANLSALIKSYKELEPLINEKANWTKEKGALTKQLDKYRDKNTDFQSKISVDLYEKALEQSSDKEKAASLIEQFRQNPTSETIKELETLFPSEVLKTNCIKSTEIEYMAKQSYLKEKQEEETKAVETYIKDVVTKNFEALKNPVTAGIFNEAFMQFGANLDADWFFGKMEELKKSFILEYQKEQSLKNEAEGAISGASKLSPNNAVSGGTSLLKRNALDLSQEELNRMLDEYYNK